MARHKTNEPSDEENLEAETEDMAVGSAFNNDESERAAGMDFSGSESDESARDASAAWSDPQDAVAGSPGSVERAAGDYDKALTEDMMDGSEEDELAGDAPVQPLAHEAELNIERAEERGVRGAELGATDFYSGAPVEKSHAELAARPTPSGELGDGEFRAAGSAEAPFSSELGFGSPSDRSAASNLVAENRNAGLAVAGDDAMGRSYRDAVERAAGLIERPTEVKDQILELFRENWDARSDQRFGQLLLAVEQKAGVALMSMSDEKLVATLTEMIGDGAWFQKGQGS